MTQFYSNYASTSLNGSITAGATTIVVNSSVGFPATGNFQITIDNNEILQVTGRSGNSWTVVRAYEAIGGVQTAFAHGNAAPVVQTLTVQGLNLGFVRGDGAGLSALDQYGYKLNDVVTASGAIGVGISEYPTVTAAANNDSLALVRIADATNKGTLATGTFTGLTVYGLAIDGANFQKTGTGTIANTYSLYVTAPTIGTNNYAAILGSSPGDKVGIGTTAPIVPIHAVLGTGGTVAALETSGAAQVSGILVFRRAGGNKSWLGLDASDNLIFLNAAATQTLLTLTNTGHLVSGGAAPTVVGNNAVTINSITGTDTRFVVNFTVPGGGLTAGLAIFTATFASAFGAAPLAWAAFGSSPATSAVPVLYAGPTTTQVAVYVAGSLPAGAYNIYVWVMG